MMQALDPASLLTCRRFLLTVALLMIWSATLAPQAVFAAMALLSSGCATLSALVALLRRERFSGPSLNRWDEAAALSPSTAWLDCSSENKSPGQRLYKIFILSRFDRHRFFIGIDLNQSTTAPSQADWLPCNARAVKEIRKCSTP